MEEEDKKSSGESVDEEEEGERASWTSAGVSGMPFGKTVLYSFVNLEWALLRAYMHCK